MVDRLSVFRGATRVGTLYRERGFQLAFEYDESYVEFKHAVAISASLPLRGGRNSELAAHAFFANLLPEGQLREAVARQLGISSSNDFALLEALGGECAGALSVLPFGVAPAMAEPQYERLDPTAVAEMARRYSVLPDVSARRAPRLSLAGAQDKLPVRCDDDGALWLPLGGSPSTHILKVPSRDFGHLPANEVLCSRLARRLGLAVVDVHLVRLDGVEVAVVRRYDREHRDGGVERLHQEDLCQALGLMPGTKYEQEGGPTILDAMTLVRRLSTNPLVDALQLIRWLVFSVLAGNSDGHGKNLSILYRSAVDTRLAPFYDLVCTRAYERLDPWLAMSVGNVRDPGNIGRKQWDQLATEVGIGQKLVVGEVERLAAAMPEAFSEVAGELSERHGELPIAERIAGVIDEQCRRSLRLLKG